MKQLIHFSKYQGTGNDFVMLNNLTNAFEHLSIDQIQRLCDRRFGIGADGLILIQNKDGYDFEMDYYNSDGSKSFCGNGARCAVQFAHELGITQQEVVFYAIDGMHRATKNEAGIELQMNDVKAEPISGQEGFINTGSPHFMRYDDDLSYAHIFQVGKSIRYSETYQKEGVNVNLIRKINASQIAIATYERGVEDETLSCGTGATACALFHAQQETLLGEQLIEVQVKGGVLKVKFHRTEDQFKNIYLIGPAEKVFEGEMYV